MPVAPRILVVGAGAVGLVFGHHLARGGAAVSFLVRDKYAADCRQGFTLYPLNRSRRQRTRPVRFDGAPILTDVREVAAQTWDQVYVTVSSTALRTGWFAEVAAAIGDATVVLLQAGPDDRAYALGHLPEGRLVQGLISLISYPAPLPGETRFPDPGMAYWFPPLAPSPMSGPPGRRDAVVAALRAGGLPARGAADVAALTGPATAATMPLLLHLEASGWSFARAVWGRGADGRRLTTAFGASREALAIVAAEAGRRPPAVFKLLLHALPLRLLIRVARALLPLDLETYLRAHFTKVGDQTRLYVQRYIELGRELQLPVSALQAIEPVAVEGPRK